MGKALDFSSMSVEEAQNALGITFTKQQRESFEANIAKATADKQHAEAIEAIDAKTDENVDSEEFYAFMVGVAERFESVKSVERNQGRGAIVERVLRVPTAFGSLKVSLSTTVE